MKTKSNIDGLTFQILGANKIAVSDSSGEVLACESTIDLAFKAAKARIDLTSGKDDKNHWPVGGEWVDELRGNSDDT